MWLEVIGDVVVQGASGSAQASRIDVAGKGYAGIVSNEPGLGGSGPIAGGGGHGGDGGRGGSSPASPRGGNAYDSIEEPTLFGGSGGFDVDGFVAGGQGGGVIRLNVNGTLTVNGSISADGEASPGADAGAGAGGSIWITASTLAGTGVIKANGGSYSGTANEGGGGGGRISLYALNSPGSVSLQATGGTGSVRRAGAGTVFRLLQGLPSVLQIDNGHAAETDSWLTPMSGALTYDQLTIAGGARVGPRPASAGSPGIPLQLTVLGDCTVNTNSRLTADFAGYYGSDPEGRGVDGRYAGGGGHAGQGGVGRGESLGGDSYGSIEQPARFGGCGGRDTDGDQYGGSGGGAIRLVVGGTLAVSGTISADGENSPGVDAGAGAGGSVWITASAVTGSGVIRANGGTYTGTPNEGGGAGGRVAVYSGAIAPIVQARGGSGWSRRAGAGTIYKLITGQPSQLTIDNGFPNETDSWLTPMSGALTYDQLTIAGGARVGPRPASAGSPGIPLQLTVLGDCTVNTNSRLTADFAGFLGSDGPGRGESDTTAGGGGHGGHGGSSSSGKSGGAVYDSLDAPLSLGSGGGADTDNSYPGGRGGGAIRLDIGGTLTVSGTISADGENSLGGDAGAGAGGSVWITAGTVTGSGVIRANGGAYTGTANEGGGGGGRVSLTTCDYSLTGANPLSVRGGNGFAGGCDGTIFLNHRNRSTRMISSNDVGYTTQLVSPATVNSPPPAFNLSTWIPLVGSDRRQTDGPTDQSFQCENKPPAPSFVSADWPLIGIDEVTFDDCSSAYYRFTFTLPAGFVGASLLGTANVDDAATVWLNGNLLSAAIDPAKWNKDYTDASCRNALTWSTGADFGATNQAYFRPGVNELIFAVNGNFSRYEPTGLEFYAFVQHTAPSNTTTVISRHPMDAQLCTGESVNFSVTASGQGSISYEWRRDGAALSDGPTTDGSIVSGSRTAVLSISNAQKSDRGAYTCAVSNPCGAAVSDYAILDVCACLACPADFNQDGGIDGTDVDDFFEAWETGTCDADVNADGGIDGGDVDYFFFTWENGGCG
ncbi:MAG: immunoglobulin domain-containing protein [Planctomycetes bacterium]|nr:immunoglobulin domain-containing protein [Planctomycetota bacterium]